MQHMAKVDSKTVNIVFPHQLFRKSDLMNNGYPFYLVEEFLFFRQFAFHKQKLAFHRATMRFYQSYLEEKHIDVIYIESFDSLSDIRELLKDLEQKGITHIHVIDPVDNWIENRLKSTGISVHFYDSPLFLNLKKDNAKFFRHDKQFFFQTNFYKQQRKKFGILLDKDENPTGGKWTYDTENRKKYPRGKTPPGVHFPGTSAEWKEAVDYIKRHFIANPGELSSKPLYPTDYESAQKWFQQFLDYRFYDFGAYEDAIVTNESILNHSVISPLINVGLLQPGEILDQLLSFAGKENIPLNSVEGFVRQIIGWREFIRGMYEVAGSKSRTQNFWQFNRKIPACFYDGTTGITPIDNTIKKVLKTGYCHHIERLMVLGNFMLLCEFEPDEVYRWFMELFIDAYDWVMVPNVYGMSQFADDGRFATKPYIAGSNYIRKMSDYPKGDWEKVWDGLFWRFIHHHQNYFKNNPRVSMMYHSWNRMSKEKRMDHLKNAEEFIEKLYRN